LAGPARFFTIPPMGSFKNEFPALELEGLSKRFGDNIAVDSLDLSIRRGELYALLGPNGAGKTTTLRMLAGLLPADAGAARILGIDVAVHPEQAKRPLAWLPDEPMLYDKLRPGEYLAFVAGLWRIAPEKAGVKSRELLDWLGLAPHAGEFIEGFSRGMRQKLALAGALVHDPKVLILDEPLTGLDAAAARQVKDALLDRVKAGDTVVLTTHVLETTERLATRIGIISRGRIVAQGTLDELRAKAGDRGGTLEDVFLGIVSEPAAKHRHAAV
jgi:ABC-2 type transport system ATP-binding protein